MVVVSGITAAGYYKLSPYLYKPSPLPGPSCVSRRDAPSSGGGESSATLALQRWTGAAQQTDHYNDENNDRNALVIIIV